MPNSRSAWTDTGRWSARRMEAISATYRLGRRATRDRQTAAAAELRDDGGRVDRTCGDAGHPLLDRGADLVVDPHGSPARYAGRGPGGVVSRFDRLLAGVAVLQCLHDMTSPS